jgi:hypothetical protein
MEYPEHSRIMERCGLSLSSQAANEYKLIITTILSFSEWPSVLGMPR